MILKNLAATKKLAKKLARNLPGRIFALTGSLGSGKTTFTQFFLRALGVEKKITSPTFLIIKNYELRISNYQRAYHVDCYRLKDSTELLNLNFSNIIKNEENVVLIEWAEKVKDWLPKETVWVYFKHGQKEGEREIKMDML